MSADKMRLQSLNIHARYGGEGYGVTATFVGAHEVKLNVPDDLGNQIVRTCMDEIINQIRAVAESVTAETLLRGPEIAAKEIEHQP